MTFNSKVIKMLNVITDQYIIIYRPTGMTYIWETRCEAIGKMHPKIRNYSYNLRYFRMIFIHVSGY